MMDAEEKFRQLYRDFNSYDLAKDLRQSDKDRSTYSKWVLLILSGIAIYDFYVGAIYIGLFLVTFSLIHIYTIFRAHNEIKRYDKVMGRLKRQIAHLYIYGEELKGAAHESGSVVEEE